MAEISMDNFDQLQSYYFDADPSPEIYLFLNSSDVNSLEYLLAFSETSDNDSQGTR